MWRDPAEGAFVFRGHGRSTLTALDVGQQQGESPIDDCGEISTRDRMAQQLLHAAKFGVGVAGHRELDLETLNGQGFHDRRLN